MEHEARYLREQVNDSEIAIAISKKEVTALQQKLDRLVEDNARERKEKEVLIAKEQDSRTIARESKEQVVEVESKISETQAAEKAQAEALSHLQKEYSMLVAAFDTQRKNHMDTLRQVEHDFEIEREESIKEARRQQEALRLSASAAIEKENKRTEKYKEAARSAHESGKRVRSQLLKVESKRNQLRGGQSQSTSSQRKKMGKPTPSMMDAANQNPNIQHGLSASVHREPKPLSPRDAQLEGASEN
mmetsp:Transcript_25816/g.33600  ORF Transcript_25816/g.33600 Transcript_25816/m.33600 type:complete len:246 (-) Transcript_25816:159-896(-)